MKWLILFISYYTVSGGLFWSNVKSNDKIRRKNNNFGDIFSDLLNDFNLDISFTPNTNLFSNEYIMDNQDTNNNYFIDESPSSMITFPSIFNNNAFIYKQSEPLYLSIQSPQTKTSNTYTLTNTNKVNGNTFRYTINTNDNIPITQSLVSTNKMYLCNTASCSNNGIEMKNIFDNKYKNYMHLIPTSTMISLETEENNNDENIIDVNGIMNININKDTNEESHVSLNDYVLNTFNKLLDKFNLNTNDNENDEKYMDDTDYEENYMNENIVYDNNDMNGFMDNNNRILMDNNTRVLVNDSDMKNEEKTDIFYMEITAIIIFIMICGVFYAGWRFLLDRREKQREMDYYKMNGINEL